MRCHWVNRCLGKLPAVLSFPYFKGDEITNMGGPCTSPRSGFPSEECRTGQLDRVW